VEVLAERIKKSITTKEHHQRAPGTSQNGVIAKKNNKTRLETKKNLKINHNKTNYFILNTKIVFIICCFEKAKKERKRF